MTAFTSRTLARHASLLDLAAIWVTLTATFAYLEVPLVNAPLFATALVLQAALGTVVITRLLKDAQPSLLMLLGPGLILGGALSFAIFQLTGRGVLGTAATLLIGIASAILIVRTLEHHLHTEPRWWMLGQLAGMGTLAITQEFSELLPVAVVLLGLGFLTDPPRARVRWFVFPSCIVGAVVIVGSLLLRRDYWWLVTDDYLLLEVISRHLTVEGPLRPWGANSFTNYHWLSYGWSGLLNHLGGSPEPLVTLTRVMPILYSLSMAASLTLIVKRLRADSMTMIAIVSAWAVIAVGRFEWTGTSTGGVYAVLAAVVALALSIRLGRDSIVSVVVILVCFFVLVVLTKLPSIFAMGLSILVGLLEVLRLGVRPVKVRILGYFVGLVLIVTSLLLAVHLFGMVVDDRIRLTGKNFGLGQLAYFDLPFVVLTLVLNQLWLWFLIGLAAWQTIRSQEMSLWKPRWLITVGTASLVSALVLEATLFGAANEYTYFSGPLYFLASLSVLLIGAGARSDLSVQSASLMKVCALISAGLLWGMPSASSSLWNLVGRVLMVGDTTRIELLKFFTSDRRFGVSLAALVILIMLVIGRRTFSSIAIPSLVALILLTFGGLVRSSLDDYRTEVSSEQITGDLGSISQQNVGRWIRENSVSGDVVGTNFLFDELKGDVSDYALAVWSEREFFVLGPKLGYGTSSARTSAFELSRSFAEEPTEETCARLRAQRVRWFIVDTQLTRNRVWTLCANEVFSDENFLVLKLY